MLMVEDIASACHIMISFKLFIKFYKQKQNLMSKFYFCLTAEN